MQIEIIIALSGIIVSVSALVWSILSRLKLDRQKYAIDMIKEWNNNTSTDTQFIRSFYHREYDKCEPIGAAEIDKIVNLPANGRDKEKYHDLKSAIYRLLNYFEFVSAAYNRGTADREIIRNSFSVTMLRYYVVLRNFLIQDFLSSRRNHWKPFCIHLKSLISKKEKLICPGCEKNNCILGEDTDMKRLRLLDILIANKLNSDSISYLEHELKLVSSSPQ